MPASVANKAKLPSAGRDRRPLMAALAVLLILAGAVLAGVLVMVAGNRTEVLVAASDIRPGQELTADDFAIASVNTDSDAVIPRNSLEHYIGAQAIAYVPAGAFASPAMFVDGSAIPADGEIVGMVLSPSQLPTGGVEPGDVIRIYSGATDDLSGLSGEVLVESARVVDVSAEGGVVNASVLVSDGEATELVPRAAAGQVAVSQLAPTTPVDTDFVDGTDPAEAPSTDDTTDGTDPAEDTEPAEDTTGQDSSDESGDDADGATDDTSTEDEE